jgi:hypothetical protein
MATWSLTGNTLGASPTGFLGTTDNNALVIKTGSPSTERLRVDPSGNVGIGTAAPTVALHLALGKVLRIEGGTGGTDANDYFSFGGNGTFGIDAPGIVNGRFVVQNDGQVRVGWVGTFGVDSAWRDPHSLPGSSPQAIPNGRFVVQSDGHVRVGPEGTFGVDAYDFGHPILGGPQNVIPDARFVIDLRGNVGIGTTAPHSALQIKTLTAVNEGVTAAGAWANLGSNAFFDGAWQRVDATKAGVCLHMNADGAGQEFRFMRMEADGTNPRNIAVLGSGTSFILESNVGIGTNAPTSRLHVAGDVAVTGDVLLTGADCVEEFDVCGTQPPDAGTVMVIDASGGLRESADAYDKKVAGVVSGGGAYRHALVLDKRTNEEGRAPVALVGKVYCKVDASFSPIEVGDLLTTSPRPGYAMKASDSAKAFGSVIGKALKSLPSGANLIPILVALQ